MCSFGFIKYKKREAANAALATLGGKQMADFPGQAVGNLPICPADPSLGAELAESSPGHSLLS